MKATPSLWMLRKPSVETSQLKNLIAPLPTLCPLSGHACDVSPSSCRHLTYKLVCPVLAHYTNCSFIFTIMVWRSAQAEDTQDSSWGRRGLCFSVQWTVQCGTGSVTVTDNSAWPAVHYPRHFFFCSNDSWRHLINEAPLLLPFCFLSAVTTVQCRANNDLKRNYRRPTSTCLLYRQIPPKQLYH